MYKLEEVLLNISMTLFPKRFVPKDRQGKAQNKALTIG